MNAHLDQHAHEFCRLSPSDQQGLCEWTTRFNRMGTDDKVHLLHRLFQLDHGKSKSLILSIEYRRDFVDIISDQGVFLFYSHCLRGTPQELDIV